MPKSRPSLNPFRLLAESWAFFRAQPALLSVLFWFLILPEVVMDLLGAWWPVDDLPESSKQISQVGYGVAQFVTGFIALWGVCCVLLVGRRMVKSRAGRARTSFRLVRRESARMILPLFFTSLLRDVITIEFSLLAVIPASVFLLTSDMCRPWISPVISVIGSILSTGTADALLYAARNFAVRCWPVFLAFPLLIPAAIYQLRSVFFPVILASEGLRYRDALRRSKAVAKGKTWKIFWVLLGIGIPLFIPALILSQAFSQLQLSLLPAYPVVSTIIDDVLYACVSFLFLLGLVALYGKLTKAKKDGPMEVVPEEI